MVNQLYQKRDKENTRDKNNLALTLLPKKRQITNKNNPPNKIIPKTKGSQPNIETKNKEEPKIELTESEKKSLEQIKQKIFDLKDKQELIISPEELAKLGEFGKRMLEKFLTENNNDYYFAYTKAIYELNGNKTELEGTYLYIYKKTMKREQRHIT